MKINYKRTGTKSIDQWCRSVVFVVNFENIQHNRYN